MPRTTTIPTTNNNAKKGNRGRNGNGGKRHIGKPISNNGYLLLAKRMLEDPITIPELVEKICGLYGVTDAELATFFDTSPPVLWKWRQQFPELDYSIKRGRDRFDTEKVERNGLLKRAMGFEYLETTRELKQVYERGEDGKNHIAGYEMQVTKEVNKVYPPDTTACIFWLGNRHPERWKHVQSIMNGDKPVQPGNTTYDNSKHLHLHKGKEEQEDVPDDSTAVQILRILEQCGQFGPGSEEVIDTEAEQMDQAEANA